jgi:peptide/nickel transport system substrate-binding protein
MAAEERSYWDRFWRTRISRRRLLCAAGVGGAGLAAAAIVGCGDDDTTPNGGALSPTSIPQSPQLTALGFSIPTTLDPHANVGNQNNLASVRPILGEGLLFWDYDFTMQPDLAASLPTISDDSLTYTFTLRDGLTFSNGKPLNAAAVIENFERMRDPNTKSQALITFERVKQFNAPDALTVEIILEEPSPLLLSNLGWRHMITDVSVYSDTDPIGAGPFLLEDFIPNERIVYRKNPDYYDADRIHFDRLVNIFSSDEEANLNALRTGEWDISAIPLVRRQEFAGSDEFTILERPGVVQSSTVFWKVNEPPFSDARLREAVDLVINREDVQRTVYSGQNIPGAGWLHPDDPFFVQEIFDGWTYDEDRARQLVTEAGAEGLTIDVHHGLGTVAGVPHGTFAEYFKNQVELIGLRVNLLGQELGTLIRDVLFPRNFNTILLFSSARPDPDALFRAGGALFHSKAGFNWSNVADPDLDDLLDRASREVDFDARFELYTDAQERIAELRSLLSTGFTVSHSATNKNIQGYRVHQDEGVRYYKDVFKTS